MFRSFPLGTASLAACFVDVLHKSFFFQAEDGIRDSSVTGVQTCALPISLGVLEGHVKASVVSVGGELHGNIENAKRVELLETGVINGDVKAGSLTVAAGSRMRGQVEFRYEGEGRRKTETKGFRNASAPPLPRSPRPTPPPAPPPSPPSPL